jgi:hypothetical protein
MTALRRPPEALSTLQQHQDALRAAFLAQVDREFPGRGEYDWHRACAAVRGEDRRRNSDETDDAALASSETIRAAWDKYIKALHEFYRARDGERGVLGGRGL